MGEVPGQLTEEKERTTFWCPSCKHRWETGVERVECVETSADGPYHPFEYFAACPECKKECNESPQIKNLYKAWLNLTGTKSPEISAENLKKVDPARRQFNALKHGMFAKKAKYFPAKTGKYPECEDCQHATECEESGICLEISKIKMMVEHAVTSRDPKALNSLLQNTQADLFVILQRMITAVMQTGVELSAPVFASNKDGYDLVKLDGNQVYEYSAHPLLKMIGDFVQKNNLSLGDLLLTPKTAEEADKMNGQLEGDREDRQSMREYLQKRDAMMDIFLSGDAALIAAASRKKDPIAEEAISEVERIDSEDAADKIDKPVLPGDQK